MNIFEPKHRIWKVYWTSIINFSDPLQKESIVRGDGGGGGGGDEIRRTSLPGNWECNVKIRTNLMKKSFYFTFLIFVWVRLGGIVIYIYSQDSRHDIFEDILT